MGPEETDARGPSTTGRTRVRWAIGGLLFASTVINYIDRQTLSALAPILQDHFHWTNSDFASLLISFRVGYTIMQGLGGRLLDEAAAFFPEAVERSPRLTAYRRRMYARPGLAAYVASGRQPGTFGFDPIRGIRTPAAG